MQGFGILHPKIIKALEELGFEKPTHAQKETLEKFSQKHQNYLLISETGSGKTEAAILPIFNQILKEQTNLDEEDSILALYITPLRALNRDMFKRLIKLGEKIGIKVGLRHGDTSSSERRKQLKSPPHVLITTPETLQIILVAPKFKEHLKKIRWVIIDEIHELAESKRGTQLVVGLERLREFAKKEFVRIGLSATIKNMEEIAQFLVGVNGEYLIIDTRQKHPPIVKVIYPLPIEEDNAIAQKVNCTKEAAARLRSLVKLIEKHESVLVFTNTRQFAEILGHRLSLLKPSFTFMVHHGSLAKEHRIQAETEFKQGKINCIICTSSLELGIDIGHVDAVIQFMSPRQVSPFLQRIGRSRHQLGRRSLGYIISVSEEDALESAVIAEQAIKGNVEKIGVWQNPLDVLAHQIVGIVQEKGKIPLIRAHKIITKAVPFKNLSFDKTLKVCELLNELRIINFDGAIIKRSIKTREYYFDVISMIVDTKKYKVIDVREKRLVAVLDDRFVETRIDVGSLIVVKGSLWKVVEITEEEVRVTAMPPTTETVIPSWVGELIPIPFNIAQKVLEYEEEIIEKKNKANINNLPLDEQAKKSIINFLKNTKEEFNTLNPAKNRLVIEKTGAYYILYTYLGTKGNEGLGRLIAALITSKFKGSVGITTDAYRIILEPVTRIKVKEIIEIIKSIEPDYVEFLLRASTAQTDLYTYTMKTVGTRFGIISPKAEINKRKLGFLVKKYQNSIISEEIHNEIMHNYYDIKAIQWLIKKIKQQEIFISYIVTTPRKATTLAKEGLKRGMHDDFVKPEKPTHQLIELVKKRIEESKLRAVCLYCGKYNVTMTVRSIRPPLKCPYCHSQLIGLVHEMEEEVAKIVKKKRRGEEIEPKEERIYNRALQAANLVNQAGKRAVYALAGRGIGPKTARNILLSTSGDNIQRLFEKIIEAETEYAKNRPFWD